MTDRITALRALEKAVDAGHVSTDLITAAFGNGWDDVLVLAAFDGYFDGFCNLLPAVLPGWGWGKEALSGNVYVMEIQGNGMEFGSAPEPSRAGLLAIIRALIAQDGE